MNIKAQISLEFSILFLATLLAIIIGVSYPGLYGLNKSTKISSMSLAHAAVMKMKENIEMVGMCEDGSVKVVLIKCPPGIWEANGNEISFTNSKLNYTISTNCSNEVVISGERDIRQFTIITATVEKVGGRVLVNITY
ncbi:hypothetical protein J422_05978 [Methanocaldococcus villosus KIN24-T80]|uniref:Class III signal peptide-containing protein n=1 Tax=Methanocaldococcus villosus KIN24-T80 TaxID=1069083 RepID=N6UTW0_9EURY|nr:class III signal peptide-containing protein [Methanocaldococcus villosus]ENN95784.1 hypothetical protein J422_05978 [Methanocaldococcus villosus KIN24-T80]